MEDCSSIGALVEGCSLIGAIAENRILIGALIYSSENSHGGHHITLTLSFPFGSRCLVLCYSAKF